MVGAGRYFVGEGRGGESAEDGLTQRSPERGPVEVAGMLSEEVQRGPFGGSRLLIVGRKGGGEPACGRS